MTEIFEGRCDRLYRRHVTFEQQPEEGGEQAEKKKKEEDGEDDDGRTEMKIPQVAVAERGVLDNGRGRGVGVWVGLGVWQGEQKFLLHIQMKQNMISFGATWVCKLSQSLLPVSGAKKVKESFTGTMFILHHSWS